MRRFAFALTTLASIALLSACSSTRPARPPQTFERTVLEVDNQGFTDMAVYIVEGGQRIRIGTAVGITKTPLTIPERFLGSGRLLKFQADPIGSSRTAVSNEIFVRAGDYVRLRIPPR